jgi:hypothetical protein
MSIIISGSGLVIRDKKGTKAEGTQAQSKKTGGATGGLHENLRISIPAPQAVYFLCVINNYPY